MRSNFTSLVRGTLMLVLCGLLFASCSGVKYFSKQQEQGEDLLLARKYDDAVKVFQDALREAEARKNAEELATLRSLLGWTYAEAMRFDDGERELKEAVKIAETGKVNASLFYARLAVVDSKSGNYGEGIVAGEKALSLLADTWSTRANTRDQDKIIDYAVAHHGYPPDVLMLKTITMSETALAVMHFLKGDNLKTIQVGEQAFKHYDSLSTLMMLAPSGEKVEFFRGKGITAAVTARAHENLGNVEKERAFVAAATGAFQKTGVKVQGEDFLSAYAASGGYLSLAKMTSGTFRPDPKYSDSFNNAERLSFNGQYKEAIATYRQVIQQAKGTGNTGEASRALSQLGWLLAETGGYPEAIRLMNESTALSPDADFTAVTYARLAAVYGRLGNHEKGLEAADRAFGIVYETRKNIFAGKDQDAVIDEAMKTPGLPPDIMMIKSVTSAEGAQVTIHYLKGNYREAIRIGERAIRHFDEVSTAIALAPEREQVSAFEGRGFVTLAVGDSYLHAGEIKKGRELLIRSREHFKKARLNFGDVIAEGLIAYSFVLEGDYKTGADLLKGNLARVEAGGMEELKWRIRSTFAGVLFAEAKLIEKTIPSLQAATDPAQAQKVKSELIARNREKTAVLNTLVNKDAAARISAIIASLEKAGDKDSVSRGLGALVRSLKEEAYKNYLGAIESSESIRSLLETDMNKRLFHANKQAIYEDFIVLATDLYGAERGFEALERSKARGLVDLLATKKIAYKNQTFLKQEARLRETAGEKLLTMKRQDAKAEGIDEALNGYRDLVIKIKKEEPEYASFITAEYLKSDDVKKLLPEGVTLLEYFSTNDRFFIWVVDKSGVIVTTQQINKAGLDNKVRDFRDAITTRSRDKERTLSMELYALLIAPIKEKIRGTVLGIVGHDSLHYLPFNALLSGDKYLIEEFTIFSMPSASVLNYVAQKARPKGSRIIAFGNPDLDDPAYDLPFAQKEVEAIQGIYPATELHLRSNALESIVKERAAGFDIIHFASHAEFSSMDPLYSSIRLAKDSRDDGRLETAEIFSMNIKPYLVTLSACKTGLGAITSGDEIIGMNRAFIYAGAPSIVSSLWSVSDASTARLMEAFYRNLKTMPKAEALQQAQVSMLKSKQFDAPFFWAPFTLIGDWR